MRNTQFAIGDSVVFNAKRINWDSVITLYNENHIRVPVLTNTIFTITNIEANDTVCITDYNDKFHGVFVNCLLRAKLERIKEWEE